MQYVSMIESGHAARMSVSPGIIRPMHRSTIGIMLLSKMDDEDIGRLLRRYNAECSKQFWPRGSAGTTWVRAPAPALGNDRGGRAACGQRLLSAGLAQLASRA